MKKLFLLIFGLFSVSVFAQRIEVEIVPDPEEEMHENESKYSQMKFDEAFSSIAANEDSFFGYWLNHDFHDILKDACKWKGCRRPLLTSKQNELVEEFYHWMWENYDEWKAGKE